MADRYPDRPFPAPDHDPGGDPRREESDPLAELARLIGQADPFGTAGTAAPPHPLQSRANPRPQAYAPADEDESAAPMPPPWMQRARQEAPPPQEDPSRYDDALYGQIESGEQEYQRDPAYPDDPYAYQSEYEEPAEPKRRSSGLVTIAAVLALAVVGTGAAFAYPTYVGSPRSGEPPIIKADNGPTKIVPPPA